MNGVRTDCYGGECSCLENNSLFHYKGRIVGFLAGDYFIAGDSCDCILIREAGGVFTVILVELKDLSSTTSRGLEELFKNGEKIAGKFDNCERLARELLGMLVQKETRCHTRRFLVLNLPPEWHKVKHLLRKLALRGVKIVASPAHMGSQSIV